ncbi:MAG: hypothetical protein NXI22_05315 [bacterium]|nr:hypothetical protein [bacterium]
MGPPYMCTGTFPHSIPIGEPGPNIAHKGIQKVSRKSNMLSCIVAASNAGFFELNAINPVISSDAVTIADATQPKNPTIIGCIVLNATIAVMTAATIAVANIIVLMRN